MELSVASGAVDGDQGGEDAHQEEDQHHVLREPDILLLNPGRAAATEEIILRDVELSATKATSGPRLLQGLNVVLINYPGIDAELKWINFTFRLSINILF